MKIVIVIPAKNEAKYIKMLMTNLLKYNLDIVLVDDGSTDETKNISFKYTPFVLTHSFNLGKGSALKTGCEYAFEYLKADAVILMDCDGQHSPAEIPLFQHQLEKGNSLILGVRNSINQMPILKYMANASLSRIIRFVYGVYVPDIPSGYKAFTKKIYQQIIWDGNGYEVELEIALKIATLKLQFTCIKIQTIYLDHTKGMTILDLFGSLLKVFLSKLY